MADAFIDESWLTSTATGDYFLAVVAVITSRRRKIELLVRRAKKTPKLRAKSEIRASVTPPSLVKKMLRALASDPELSIVAVIWREKQKDVIKPERLYQSVVGRCALHTVQRNPRIDLWVDKRYTDDFQKRELEGAVREAIAVVPGNIVRVFQEESHIVKELAAPDFVAWAFMQYYGRGNDEFYRLVRSRVVRFEELSGKKKSGSPLAPITTARSNCSGGLGLPNMEPVTLGLTRPLADILRRFGRNARANLSGGALHTLVDIATSVYARSVRFEGERMIVTLADDREISVPIEWYPRLAQATIEQRSIWRLIGGGEDIHWPEVDEDLPVIGIVLGLKLPASLAPKGR